MTDSDHEAALLVQTTLDGLPPELRDSIDAHIKARIRQFYQHLIERKQIPPFVAEHREGHGEGVTVGCRADRDDHTNQP
jgi:hypothetical protein